MELGHSEQTPADRCKTVCRSPDQAIRRRAKNQHVQRTPLRYQPSGLAIAVPGSVSGNCAALSIAARVLRTRVATFRNWGATCHPFGQTTRTGRLSSSVREGDCLLADQWYSTTSEIGYLAQTGGRVTVRVNPGSRCFQTPRGQAFDLLEEVSQLKTAGATQSWRVRVAAPRGRLGSGRVCAIRKREEAIQIPREGIHSQALKKGRQIKPETLQFARLAIVFTTFPAEAFPGPEVVERYRLGWQVELVFKRFKSPTQLGHLPKHDGCSAKAWLYGKLLVALVVEELIGHAFSVSPRGFRMRAPSAARRMA